jgi:predicted transcriptional regulator
MERKRNRLEVIRDILTTIRNKNGRIKPTHILYKSNLSHIMMQDYLKELIQKQFIKEIKKDNSRTYTITDKGLKYLSEYDTISSFMESFGLESKEE